MIEEQYGESKYGSVKYTHTLDPSQAIERILEAKGILFDEKTELKRQYEIYKILRAF